ncbi:uncharacterized protein [Diadema antillarum]|uniref:uncharacterized protein n=1 Tax=Diadema antillarum TaxID=105358 RepID=UPI003A839BEA
MSSLTVDPPGNVCKVIAHQAKGLIFKGKDDTNNAFVTFTLGKSKFATSVLDRVRTAVWNEECEFVISDHGGTLELVVCHSDFLRERFLGRVEVSVSGIAASYGKCVRKWYKLQPKKGQEGKKTGDRGQLEVTVQILYRKDVESEVKGQDKKSPSLLNILPSPAWRRKSSGASSDGRRRDSHNAQEDFLNDYNMEMQFHDQVNVDPFYSDDSHSIASSMSDDHRSTHHALHHHHLDIGGVHGKNGGSSLPNTPPRKAQNKPRPSGLQGSARGKGGLGRNVKAAFGNISKALSKEHVNKIGLSTPDLRFLSSSDPSSPTPPQHHKDADRLGDAGADEPDSGGPASPSQQGKERVHLGVSSLVGSLHPPAAPLSHAVSEESLLTAKDKVQSDTPKDKEDAYAYTTLPRGKHAKGHTRHKKTMSACITTLSELGYHGDDGGDRRDRHRSPTPEKPALGEERHRENREGREGRSTRGGSKYDTLSRQQLVHLVQEQESILSANLDQIKELEGYIEKLLLRIMVESPQLLDQNHPIRL